MDLRAWNDEIGLHCHRITWTDDQFNTFGLDTVAAGEPEALTKAGTRVTIRNVRPASERLQASKTRKFLETKLGVFLEKYPDVTVTLDGKPLSQSNVQGPRAKISFPVPDETRSSARFAGCSETAELEVIEWRIPVTSAIWVAGPTGAPSDEIPFREAHPGLAYTAWLRWDGWPTLGSDIAFIQMAEDTEPLVAAAKEALSKYLRTRSSQRATELLEDWKEEGSYPYDGEPSTSTERAERELFDIVAVTAAPALEPSDSTGRKFSLRLLAEAVRTDQSALSRILTEVLALDDATQEQLAGLLDRAPLSAIVELSHTVFRRTAFLDWLEKLLYDKQWSTAVGETPGLHDLLAPNTWVFGDQWNFMTSEVGLTNVAREHEKLLATDLDDDTAYDNDAEHQQAHAEHVEVLDPDGKRRRLDLLLVRAGGRRDEPHYFVIELKRPSRRLTRRDFRQIENYLDTLGAHPRFANPKIRWTFMLVGKDCVPEVTRSRTQDGRPVGLASRGTFTCGSKYELWVRTWAEVLSEANQRLEFLRTAMDEAPTTSAEFEQLHQLHSDVLPSLEDVGADTTA